MFLMLAEVLSLGRVAKALPDHRGWQFLAFHQSHVEWRGCSLHDLIQPSFSFLVGVALALSLANRARRGQSFGRMAGHALFRAVALTLLGVFLRSIYSKQTNWTFEDTLTQIGLGYFFLFLLGFVASRWQWVAFAGILAGYWAAFALYPSPGADFDWQAVGVPADWAHHPTGFAAHWDKNSNLAAAFDRWWMNLFPREKPFTHNGGGYATLSFIPTLATMILGLIAGGWLREGAGHRAIISRFVLAGLIGLAAGWAFDRFGICPNVKKIWTPSWVLFSGGWCFLLLAGFYLLIEPTGYKGCALPLVVIGSNSIAAYLMSWMFKGFIRNALHRHIPDAGFEIIDRLLATESGHGIWQRLTDTSLKHGTAFVPLVEGALILLVIWLLLLWLWRHRVWVKI